LKLPGLTAESFSFPEVAAKFDLTLDARERDEGIEIRLVYNRDLFGEARMEVMLGQLEDLLSQIVKDPEEKIACYSLVTSATGGVLPDPTSVLDATWEGGIHTLFSRQACQAPGRLAVVDPHDIWSYGELEARSNQLAHYLRACGIQGQDVVAVYAHRSASLVWALLGVLKAGAAFLILDPAYPVSRLIDYLLAAQPRGWLQLEAAGTLPEALEEFVGAFAGGCRLVLPRREMAAASGFLEDRSTEDPDVIVGSDDLAYVAFTSGSTGKPKGVLCRHGPVSHFLPWSKQRFGFSEADRFSMLTGLSFNPLHREIFTSLWLGATICVPDSEDMVPGRLAEWMGRERVTVTHLTPAMGRVLCGVTEGITLSSLRYAVYAGDLLRRQDVRMLRRLAPQVKVVNFYGATETQRAVGHFIVSGEGEDVCEEGLEEERLKEAIPLGRGIQDVQLLVLNGAQRLAGVGEMGEIYFRSPHLAKGYLGDEQLTVERFVVNPVTGKAADRLYRTFELGRYLPDGGVEMVGRVDHQVKIRGFRVELGEVETVLGEHAAVRETAVTAQEDELRGKRLIAYVVSDPGVVPSAGQLRRFLKEKLPEYMIPSAFVYLDSLPLTPNGKVDRRALPQPSNVRPEGEEEFVAPRTPMERAIAEIWQDLLGVEKVGVDDNFFDLGGHSLLSIQVVARLEKKLGLHANPKELILRNLAQLARSYEERVPSGDLSKPANTLRSLYHSAKTVWSYLRQNRQ
jgi:amino acid adenylation domain-containing protein